MSNLYYYSIDILVVSFVHKFDG